MKRTIINSGQNSIKSELKEIFEYRDLLFFLVLRDVKVLYKQTILGFLWAIIQPLVAMILFTIFFGKFAGIEEKLEYGIPYAVFAYVALVPWTYLSSSLSASANSLVGSVGLINKVYFPRLFIPLTPILAKLVDFFISLTVLFILFGFYDILPFMNRIIYVPLLIGLMSFTAFGVGLWLSAMSMQYRDVKFILPFILQSLMFASPIIWPISFVPEEYQLIYSINPVVGIIEGFREAIIGVDAMPWDLLKVATASSSVIFISGLLYFRRMEGFFADVA